MTNWSELDDLGLNEELDEFDPLAPMSDGGADEPVEADDDELNFSRRSTLLNAEGEFDVTGGFMDPAGVCRVWVDEAGVIQRVRISPNWRDRVGKSGSAAVGLAGAFTIAFASIHGWQVLAAENQTVEFFGETGEATSSLTWEALGQAQRDLDALHARLEALGPDEGHGAWNGSGATGYSHDRRVVVTLSVKGGYQTIRFDETWLEDSRVSQITASVVEACKRAKANFVPPEYVPGERDEIASAQTAVRDNLRAMIKRGFR